MSVQMREVIMDRTATLAQRICERAQQLPEPSLLELERYVEHLRIKAEALESGHEQLALLTHLADARDYRRFTTLIQSIDWSSRPAGELGRAIDLALSLQMVITARELAQLGRRLYPKDEHIQQASQVLSPPVAHSKRLPRARGLDASKTWLRDHANEYRGQWIAVHAGKLVGVAGTLDELRSAIGQDQDAVSTIVTKVP
jgi:hypothetical protein